MTNEKKNLIIIATVQKATAMVYDKNKAEIIHDDIKQKATKRRKAFK